MTKARRTRFERGRRDDVEALAPERARASSSLRVQIGHVLIGAGSWLSGERVESVRPSAHRPA